jgi:hypothetical protein
MAYRSSANNYRVAVDAPGVAIVAAFFALFYALYKFNIVDNIMQLFLVLFIGLPVALGTLCLIISLFVKDKD